VKRFLSLLSLAFVLLPIAMSAHAACSTEACTAATRWQIGYTAFILDSRTTPEEQYAAEQAIRTAGGTIAIIAERLFLGWIDPPAAKRLVGKNGIVSITRRPVDVDGVAPGIGRPAQRMRRQALLFFNDVASGRDADRVENSLLTPAEPLTGDAFLSPIFERTLPAANATTEVSESPVAARHRRAFPNAAVYPWPNDSMRGRVLAQAFALESVVVSGFPNEDKYNWMTACNPGTCSDVDWSAYFSALSGAFSMWVSEASSRGITLSFVINIWHWSDANNQTRYEPTEHPAEFDYLYLNDIMSRQTQTFVGGRIGGFGASTIDRQHVHEKIQEYNNYQISLGWYGSTVAHAFSVFTTNNRDNPYKYFYRPFGCYAPSCDGSRSFGVFGLYANIMLYDVTNTSNNYGPTVTHETGHVFWACDEYTAPDGTGCGTCNACLTLASAPRSVTNGNCESGTAGCQVPLANCIMRRSHRAVCFYTALQVGW
jgi:hypothetical protein